MERAMGMARKHWMRLAAAVMAGVMGGFFVQGAEAAEYDKGLTGYPNADKKWLTDGSSVSTGADKTVIYDLAGDNTFSSLTSAPIKLPKNKKFVINAGEDGANAIILRRTDDGYMTAGVSSMTVAYGSDVMVNGNLNIAVESAGYSASGISTDKGSGEGAKSSLVVNGDVTMRKEDSASPWAIVSRDLHGMVGVTWPEAKDYMGVRWAPSGFYFGVGKGSTADFNGNVDMAVRGSGVVTDPYYTAEGIGDYDLVTVNMNGGNVTIETPEDTKESFLAVANYGGTININMKDGEAGVHDVVLLGNVLTMREHDGLGNPYFYRSGRTNIALATKNSFWQGVLDNSGADQAGETNLWLSNNAVWDHESRSRTNALDAANMPSPSKDGHYGIYDGVSHLTALHGGDTKLHTGWIYQKAEAPIHIGAFSGYVTVVYDHDNDGSSAGDYTRGDVVIGHAAAGSVLTLSTSSKGIDLTDSEKVSAVLAALAQKLTYSGYAEGETDLEGKVQIASGLTSADTSLYIGDIVFDTETGKGGAAEDVEEAVDNYGSSLTGNPASDGAYVDAGIFKDGVYTFERSANISLDGKAAVDLSRDMKIDASGAALSFSTTGAGSWSAVRQQRGNLDITAKKLNITRINDTAGSGSWAVGIELGSMGGSGMDEPRLTVKGNTEITAEGGYAAMGIYALSGSQAVIDGDLTVHVKNHGTYEGDLGHYHTNGLYAGFGKSSITVTGDVDIASNGSGIQANANSRIDIEGGGRVILTEDGKADQYALIAEAAAVNMNVVKDADGQVTGAGKKGVQIKGNLGVLNKDTGASPNLGPAASVVNLGLSTRDSTLQGIAFNEFKEQELSGKEGVSSYARAASALAKGEINLYIANGASWTNEAVGMVKDGFTGSKVNMLAGGSDAAHAGYILQKDSRDISIDTYSGHMVVVYDHENDGAAAGDYKAGNTVIRTAAAGSGIIASTSSKGIAMDDRAAVEKTLAALANKLAYTAADANLKGEVQIASGLTTGAAVKKLGDMTWDAENGGIGSYAEGSVKDVSFEVGNTESSMMKGVRSAAVTSYLSFRDAAADVLARSRFLREGTLGEGVWAKTYGGKSRYDGAGLSNAYNYWGAQVGYSKVMENGWTAGIGLDYQDGSADYILGGSGDNTLYTLGIYLGKDMGDGAYFDAAVKAGHVENDFHVYNEIGEKLSGTYSANGYSASVQAGKRIGGDSYIEPQVQLTYAHLQPSDYDTYSGLGTMHVEQDAYDSLVGRIGLEIGNQTERGGFYGKVSLAHEFMADIGTDYSDSNGGRKRTSYDLGDTWGELTLGGTYQLNEDSRIYADLTRSIGGDYQNQWKANAGVRIFMGSGVAPGSRKQAAAALPGLPAKERTDTAPAAASPAVIQPAPAVKEQKEEAEKVSRSAMGDVTFVSARPDMTEADSPAEEASAAHSGGSAETGYTAPSGVPDGTVFELAPVVVTANRVPQPILEAKADISVVSRKEIEDMHMGTVEEALRTVPGVQFLNYGGNGINANLSGIRINGSKDIVLLVDGVRVNDFQGSNNSSYMFASLLSNMGNIERVEVLRGAAGVMYGSAAKGGVINIITRKVQKTQTVLDLSRGSFGKENYKLSTQGQSGKFDYNAYYDKSIIGDMKDGDGKTWPGHTNTKSGGLKGVYHVNDRQSVTLSYDELRSAYFGQDFIYKNKYKGDYESKNLTLRHDWQVSDLWANTLTYRRSDISYQYGQAAYSSTGSTYSTGSDNAYDFFSDQVNYTSGRHDLVFGIDYSRMKTNRPVFSGSTDGTSLYSRRWMKNYSLYAQDDWKILPQVTLSGGVRYDKPDVDSYSTEIDSHTSYSYKLSWDITEKDTVYAGRSDFYILPSLDQRYDDRYGNETLKAAEGRTTSIGYNRKFSDHHILTVNWFQTEDKTSIGYLDDGQYQNFEGGVARGWNAQWIARFNDRWSARIGWSHLFQYADGDNYAMGYYPKDLVTFGIYYTRDKWTAVFDGFYFMRKVNDRYADVRGWPADNYGVYNLSASYAPNANLTVYGKVENLFDKLWAEHTNVVHGGDPGSWYSMPGRNFQIGMQMRF